MKLLTSQKDTIFKMIESIGLSPAQFEFTSIKREIFKQTVIVEKIFYLNKAEYCFYFEENHLNLSEHRCTFCPGKNNYQEKGFPQTWESQINYVRAWLINIIREINAPNYWDRLNKEIQGIGANFEDDNNKFNVAEFEDLQRKIAALKQGVKASGLLAEQISAINNKLDSLAEQAKTLNKFDWKSLFIGTIVNIIIQMNINTADGKALWALIKSIFNNVLFLN